MSSGRSDQTVVDAGERGDGETARDHTVTYEAQGEAVREDADRRTDRADEQPDADPADAAVQHART